MPKRTPPVEWYVAESDAEWQRLCAPPSTDTPLEPATAAYRRLSTQRFLGGVAILLCLLAGAGWWRMGGVGADQKRGEIRTTAPLHQTPVASADDAAFVTDIDQPRASGGARLAAQKVESPAYVFEAAQPFEIHGDLALGRVVMYTERGEPTYRQTHFYRRMPTGWIRTDPDTTLWGSEHTLETPSFVYHFRQRDTEVVTAVAPQIEVLYTTLRRNGGLPGDTHTEKLVIEVSVTQTPGYATPWFGAPARIIVPSPSVYLAPVELTDEELLAQSIALPLVELVLAQASEQAQIDSVWQPLAHGLRLWQLWDLNLPLAAWQEEVVTWVYADLPNSRPGQAVVLPARYTALCAAHKLWLPSPAEIKIPLLCAALGWEDFYLSPWGWYEPLTHLDQLSVPLQPGEYQEEPGSLRLVRHPGQTVALATLIDYAVATYGRERLPVLVAGLGQYKSWEALLPAVFGVPPTAFEAGWQAYLAAHYGVSAR